MKLFCKKNIGNNRRVTKKGGMVVSSGAGKIDAPRTIRKQ
jgi:hypothetical protein